MDQLLHANKKKKNNELDDAYGDQSQTQTPTPTHE
jgi:hypothetical protein